MDAGATRLAEHPLETPHRQLAAGRVGEDALRRAPRRRARDLPGQRDALRRRGGGDASRRVIPRDGDARLRRA